MLRTSMVMQNKNRKNQDNKNCNGDVKRGGFTLLELLIVILILGLLAVAFIPMVMGAPKKTRDQVRVSDVKKIQNVLVVSFLDDKPIPTDNLCLNNSVFGNDVLAMFGGVVPRDPNSGRMTWEVTPPSGVTLMPNGTTECDGEYLYIYQPNSGEYDFGIYAMVEVGSSGNMDCPSGVLQHDTVLMASGDCFAVLQKL